MFNWFSALAERSLKREIDRLHTENLSLKVEVLKATGEERIWLTPEEHLQLDALRREIDPEDIQRFDVLSDADCSGQPLPIQQQPR